MYLLLMPILFGWANKFLSAKRTLGLQTFMDSLDVSMEITRVRKGFIAFAASISFFVAVNRANVIFQNCPAKENLRASVNGALEFYFQMFSQSMPFKLATVRVNFAAISALVRRFFSVFLTHMPSHVLSGNHFPASGARSFGVVSNRGFLAGLSGSAEIF